MKKFDFIVVGSGPGGIASAYELSKRFKVLIVEKGKIPTKNAKQTTEIKIGHRQPPRLTTRLRKPLPLMVSKRCVFFPTKRLENQIDKSESMIKMIASTNARESNPKVRLA